MRLFKVWLLVSAMLGLAATAWPQGKASTPNFSGIWKMDPARSDYGPGGPPDSAKYVIRHIGPKLTFDYTQDDDTRRIEVTADGQERMTESNTETETWTRVYWDGPVLVWEARQRPRPAHESPNVKWTSRWSLSPDGKVLTIQRQISTPRGQLDQTIRFDKQ